MLDDQDGIEEKKAEVMRLDYLQQYAETVLTDQGLWRLAVDYLSYCGPLSRQRMRSIILDVPIVGPDAQPSRGEAKRAEEIEADAEDAAMDDEADDPEQAAEERRLRKEAEKAAKKVSNEFNTVLDLLQTCVDLDLDLEARAICKKMATEMTRQKKYGPAIAYCVRANDVRQMKRIADLILLQYIQEGVGTFCQAVDSIPSSLLYASARKVEMDQMEAMEIGAGLPDTFSKVILGSTSNLSSSRLAFLARYRDFHREYVTGNLTQAASLLVELLTSGVAPENFWAVLLIDAVPLLQEVDQDYFSKEQAFEILRVLDHVTTASSIHTLQANHYLGLLEQLLLGPTKAKTLLTIDEDGVEHISFDSRAATTRLDILRLALARRLARMSN